MQKINVLNKNAQLFVNKHNTGPYEHMRLELS